MTRLTLFILVTSSLALSACKETREIDTRSASSEAPEPLVKSAAKKYSVEIPETLGVEPHFSVKPASGFKINLEYPWKVEFKKATNAELERKLVKRDDGITLDEARARIDVPVSESGENVEVEAIASFSVCNENVCKNYRDEPIMLSFKAPDSRKK